MVCTTIHYYPGSNIGGGGAPDASDFVTQFFPHGVGGYIILIHYKTPLSIILSLKTAGCSSTVCPRSVFIIFTILVQIILCMYF